MSAAWRGLGVLVALLVLALVFGPREPVDAAVPVDPASLPADLDAWLAEEEGAVPNLREGAGKQIVWAGEGGAKTPLSVVYLHGFSASPGEIRPVPERVAGALGANLFFTRLTGHGRDGAAMAEARAGDWIADTAEAMAVGRRLGERVLLMGTSTGGTLAAIAALDPDLSDGLAGVVLISPNVRINDPAAPLLELPWARAWLPWLMGEERGFAPVSAAHAASWTTRYPSVALVPVAALTAHLRGLDPVHTRVPALFLYSEHDAVVSPSAIAGLAAGWGGPAQSRVLVPGPGDDPSSHVIAGDILSPGLTDEVTRLVTAWAKGL